MINFSTRSVALTVAVSFLAACRCIAAPPGVEKGLPRNDPLAGTNWTLAMLGGRALLSDTVITLRFMADGSVSGSDGCNSYRGSYTVDGATIRFPSDFAATMMACPEPIMNQASAYTQALKRAASYAADADRLMLRDGSGQEVATFVAQANTVAGTSWEVTSYNNGRHAVVSVIIGSKISAAFGEGGRLTGTAGCNDYFASYDTGGETITIGAPGATRKACAEPEGVMEQEGRYLAALQSAATFRIEGNKMELRTEEGSLAVALVRSAGDPGKP